MIRISVYHWLPVARNMFPEILQALKTQPSDALHSLPEQDASGDSLTYTLNVPLATGDATLLAHGKINSRGFAQHVLEVGAIGPMHLAEALDSIAPRLTRTVASHLTAIVPHAVRNKLAVLQEGIKSREEFTSIHLEPLVDGPAQRHLAASGLTVILLDSEWSHAVRAGFGLKTLGLDVVPPQPADSDCVVANPVTRTFLLWATAFDADELHEFDGIVYMYFSVANILQTLSRVIEVLKLVRDYAFPIRRQLAIALQRHTEDHSTLLLGIKHYLSYVNIKLPVIVKVRNHLDATMKSPEFTSKVAGLKPKPLASYPRLWAITTPGFGHTDLKEDQLRDHWSRLEALLEEDLEEVRVLSRELTEVLDGNLLFEEVDLDTRKLDAVQATLELNRAGKNRENALKILSVVLSANVGSLVASTLPLGQLARFAFILAFPLLVLAWLEAAIRSKSCYFRLVIPLNVELPPRKLEAFVDRHGLKRRESHGSRRIRTWSERLRLPQQAGKSAFEYWKLAQWPRKFDITIDYEKRGYVYALTLEREYRKEMLETRPLVLFLFRSLAAAQCLEDYAERDTCLLASTMTTLAILLAPKLPSLNRLLAMPMAEFKPLLQLQRSGADGQRLSKEDQAFLDDLLTKLSDYKLWLLQAEEAATPELRDLQPLLGLHNLREKRLLLESIKDVTTTREVHDAHV